MSKIKSLKKCQYCGQEKELCQAHIVPRSFYHKYKAIKYLSINSKTGKAKQKQSGIWDDTILCSTCDNILGKYDTEAFNILLSDLSSHNILYSNEDWKLYLVDNNSYDYNKLRYFFISMLWRASISSTPEFKQINLGPYEEIALKILKNEIPDDEELFKVVVFKEQPNKAFCDVHFCVPFKIATKIAYRFFYSGYTFEIIPSLKNARWDSVPADERLYFNKNQLPIFELPEVYETKISYINKMKEKMGMILNH